MASERLSRDAWVAAGFLSLAQSGPASIQINLLAKRLGATKGSFYWHFKDLKDFKAAMLELWKSKVAVEVMEEVRGADTPEGRLDVLLSNAARPAPEEYGGRAIEPAMRAWSLSDAEVAQALSDIDTMRMAFISEVFDDLGVASPALTQLAYGAYIGLDDLQSKGGADAGVAMDALKGLILSRRPR